MIKKLLAAPALALFACPATYAQDKIIPADTMVITLDDAVISANRVFEPKLRIAQELMVLDKNAIQNSQAQNTGDVLANTGVIMVQKSQMGGGSPVLRGFEANKVLMVVDGVRMNNLIYRGGHLQNILTMDNQALDRIEVLYGPSSTVYGSDALGGVLHFYTRRPVFATGNENYKNVNAMVRYGSVNNEMTGHADFSYGGKKWASVTSFTYSSFGDLVGGKSKNFFYDSTYGERPYYVARINGKDSLVANPDKYKQVQSGYTQYDVMQKIAYKQNDHLVHSLNLQLSNSSNIPRYDRLTDPAGTGLKTAEWYYGPQQRLMAAYDLNYGNSASKFQEVHAGINYQNIEESRHTRNFDKNNLTHRTEYVNVVGANLGLRRTFVKHDIRLGADIQYNTLKSRAQQEDVTNGAVKALDTRYPDGDNTMGNYAAYATHTMTINKHLTLVDGFRLGYSSLHSTFVNKSFFPLPYTDANQNNLVYSANAGLIHTHNDNLKVSLLVSSGYRVPNVDDLAKVFESAKGSVIVPNSDLKPEKTLNTELGVTKMWGKTTWENAVYYTRMFDAIITDKYSFNGNDSIMYDGTMSRVYANQNKRKAYIYGISSRFSTPLSATLSLNAGISYTYGRIATDSTTQPLDHIPPFMAHAGVRYAKNKLAADFFINYQGAKKLADYYRNGEDNEQYATPDGMPAWMTANLRVSYKIHKMITLQAGVDNILDTQYRVFASGINAPGRNIFGVIRFNYWSRLF